MPPTLASLREMVQPAPAKFLAAQPGCWIQYYDDTDAKDPAKALSARSFEPAVARRKQQEHCSVCFSLQAFLEARTKDQLLSFRNLGVDVDLIPAAKRRTITLQEIDSRKEEYLMHCLLPFPLKPHWLIETQHGFHVIFRVLPVHKEEEIREAAALHRRVVSALLGDEHAALLTQVLRVPCTLQFKTPESPFLCRLLLDNARTILPYPLSSVRGVLDTLSVFQESGGEAKNQPGHETAAELHPQRWRENVRGVPEGQRNAAAASVIGAILRRLPADLWDTAGWGGLKEWNRRNVVPLSERELRTVFLSIARRERIRRRQTMTQDKADTGGSAHDAPNHQ